MSKRILGNYCTLIFEARMISDFKNSDRLLFFNACQKSILYKTAPLLSVIDGADFQYQNL